jgi:predicted O-methyltransferase YrrM
MHMLKEEVAEKLTELISPMGGFRILEIGTGWCESAKFLSSLKPSWIIYTIDAFGLYGDGRIYDRWDHEKVLQINEQIRQCGNIIQILGDSSTIPWELPIDVLYIDGDHTAEGCGKDLNRFAPFVRTGGFIAFDDYTQENNPANGVKEVVEAAIGESDKYKLIHRGYYCAIIQKQ